MKKIKIIIILAVSFLSLAGCFGKDDTVNPEPDTNKSFNQADIVMPENSERKDHRTFSIAMPNDWKEVEYGAQIIYLSKDAELADPLAEKVIVAVKFLPEDDKVGLREMLDAGVADTKKLIPDFTVVSTEENIAFGRITDGIKLKMTATIQGKIVEYTQISGIASGRMYALVHSCIQDQCQYDTIYDGMVKSFLETVGEVKMDN